MPPPRHHLVRFHGVFAPNAAWRKQVVPSLEQAASPASSAPAATAPSWVKDAGLKGKHVLVGGRFLYPKRFPHLEKDPDPKTKSDPVTHERKDFPRLRIDDPFDRLDPSGGLLQIDPGADWKAPNGPAEGKEFDGVAFVPFGLTEQGREDVVIAHERYHEPAERFHPRKFGADGADHSAQIGLMDQSGNGASMGLSVTDFEVGSGRLLQGRAGMSTHASSV